MFSGGVASIRQLTAEPHFVAQLSHRRLPTTPGSPDLTSLKTSFFSEWSTPLPADPWPLRQNPGSPEPRHRQDGPRVRYGALELPRRNVGRGTESTRY